MHCNENLITSNILSYEETHYIIGFFFLIIVI